MAFEKEAREYTAGLIQGIRLTLTAVNNQVLETPILFRGTVREKLFDVIKKVNDFPTIGESGYFQLSDDARRIDFHSRDGKTG